MVLDKGLSLQDAKELIATAGEYIDIIKMGWGTARLFPKDILTEKLELYRAHGIRTCPGGTFIEIAVVHNLVAEYLKEAKGLGFSCIEVSDGVIRLKEQKSKIIHTAAEKGFTVFSEVGRKSTIEDARLETEERIQSIEAELKAGAWKVIIEGRESGNLGIYDIEGQVKFDLVESIVNRVGIDNIIFETPQKNQQAWFILNYGAGVNLGNIAPTEVISLETLRLGLRADTLLQYHVEKPMITVELGPQGAIDAAQRADVIIVIDALRASTTIVTALVTGMSSVIPVTSVEECKGEITAGERGGKKLTGFTYDNSPLDFLNHKHEGKELVLTATNGTECIRAASSGHGIVLIGALVNARAVAKQAYKMAVDSRRNITLLVVGRNNKSAIEDIITATEIASYLPMCKVKTQVELYNSSDFVKDFLDSESGENLIALGKRADVTFCAQKDIYEVVPILQNGRFVMPDGNIAE